MPLDTGSAGDCHGLKFLPYPHYSFMLGPFSAEQDRASLKTTMCSLCTVSCGVGLEGLGPPTSTL